MTSKDTIFTWYAAHPAHGELIVAIPSNDAYRHSYIYCPRIIFDRLGSHVNPLLALELNLGPCGFVPRKLYEEAGFTVRTPFLIRMVAMTTQSMEANSDPDKDHSCFAEKYDDQLTHFILSEWERVYNSD